MKRILSISFASACAFLFLSCGESSADAAMSLLGEAKELYSAGEFNRTKIMIDSISAAYPKAYKARREAEILRREVLLKEKERDVEFLSKELGQLTAKRDSMVATLSFNKDGRYQDTGYYTVPSQAIKLNPYNNFLRASVRENGEAYVTSFYRGKRIAHTTVKVSSGDSYVVCDKPFLTRSYKELGVYNERRDYKYGADGGIMDFIAAGNAPFTVELSGGNGRYEYTLRAEDAEAIVRILDLANLLKAIGEAQAMCDEAQRSLDFLRKSEERSAIATAVQE